MAAAGQAFVRFFGGFFHINLGATICHISSILELVTIIYFIMGNHMPIHYTRPTLIAIALSSLFAQASAQTAAIYTLPEVVVSDSREKTLPAGQSLPNTLIQSRSPATSDTASLLQDVPGVQMYGAGGVSSLPVIHGLADDRLRIKVDGMDLIASCPNHMNPALSYLDPTNVGALKVYAGISPVSVGGDSIGGTIIAESKAPEFAAAGQRSIAKGEIGAFYRSNNDAMGGNVSATYATENFNFTYSGAVSQADNYKSARDFKTSTVTGRVGHTIALDEVGSTAYKTGNHNLGFAMKNGNHLFEAKVGYQDMPKQLYPNQRMDLLDNRQLSFNLRYLGQYDWGKLETRAYHEKVEHFMDFGADKRFWYGSASGGQNGVAGNGVECFTPGSAACAAGMPMNTEGKTTGVQVKADVNLSERNLLRVGGELQTYRLNDWWSPSGANMRPNTFWNIRDGQRDRYALFGEMESRPSAEWLTLLGGRYEYVKSDAGSAQGYVTTAPDANNQIAQSSAFNARNHAKVDHNLDLTALARYTVNAQYDVEFGLARKVRSPNLYERYTWSSWSMAALMNNFVGDGNGYVGNPDLKPEKAHTVSATFDWHAGNRDWELKATPFFTHVADYVDAVRTAAFTPNAFNVLQYANQSARLYGLDLSGKMPLAKTSVGQFGLKGVLNYTNGKNRDTGDELYNIMPLNAKLTLTQKAGGWDNGLEVVMVKSKSQTSDIRNEIKTPGYTLVNLRTSHTWNQVRVDFGIENLFNKFYYLPLGGAYNGQGTTMTTGGASSPAWGVAVPGMGRSAYVGINVKF